MSASASWAASLLGAALVVQGSVPLEALAWRARCDRAVRDRLERDRLTGWLTALNSAVELSSRRIAGYSIDMGFTLTARCYYCGRKFDATSVGCEDASGRLCCPDCDCDHCGHGHTTTADWDDCLTRVDPDADPEDVDPDARYDARRDALTD